jgi:hypothetical protein
MSPIAEAVALAAPTFSGQLLLPTDPSYDQRRRVPQRASSTSIPLPSPAAVALPTSSMPFDWPARSGSRCRYAAEGTTSRGGRRSMAA